MPGELIKERHSSYLPRPLELEPSIENQENETFAHVDRFTSTIASCRDFPLPNHAAKALFLEEVELNTTPIKEQQQKEKMSFFQRLKLANLKAEIKSFLARFKDTLSSIKAQVGGFFGYETPVKKMESFNRSNAAAKKSEKSLRLNSSDTPADIAQAEAESTRIEKIDLENKRISEIEDLIGDYNEELQKNGGGDMKTMMEMACKMAILVGSLGYRYNKREMKEYMQHLEVNVKKRVETFEGKRTWTYVTVGLQFAAAGTSFLGIGGILGKTSVIGNVMSHLGKGGQAFAYAGDATSKLDNIEDQKKTGLREDLTHDGEKIKQWKSDMDRTNEKTHQSMEQMMAAWRNMMQAHSEAVKRAAPAA